MIITLKKNVDRSIKVHINDTEIEYVSEYKYLGVVIDDSLNFNAFCELLIGKMWKKYHLMKNISAKLNRDAMITLYNSIVCPHVDYCSTVLFLMNDQQIAKLQKMQNRFMRLILKLPFDTSIKYMLEILAWLSIRQRINYNSLKFIYKVENEEFPQYLKRNLLKKETSYSLRNQDDYVLPDFKKQITQNCLFYKGLADYNDLKNKYSFNNKNEFKKCCLEYVKNQY
jgi:hypothetical protein